MNPPTFQVLRECICCSVCTDVSPAHFRLDDEIAVVVRQPEGPAELALCHEAKHNCPVEAIVDRA